MKKIPKNENFREMIKRKNILKIDKNGKEKIRTENKIKINK